MQLPLPSIRYSVASQRRHVSTTTSTPVRPEPVRVVPSTRPPDLWIQQITNTRDVEPNEKDLNTAWEAYISLHAAKQLELLTPNELMMFCNSIALFTHEYKGETRRTTWQLWGRRLLSILQGLDHRIPEHTLDDYRQTWYCHRVRGLALAGMLEQAKQLLWTAGALSVDPDHRAFILTTYDIVIRCIHYYKSPRDVLQLILGHWKNLNSFLVRRPKTFPPPKTMQATRAFRTHVDNIVATIENPVEMLRSLAEPEKGTDFRRRAATLLIDSLCIKDLTLDALAVFKEAQSLQLGLSPDQHIRIIKALAKAEEYELANTMFVEFSTWAVNTPYDRRLYGLGLYLFAQQGDVSRVEEYARKLEDRGGLERGDITLMIHVHAVRGDPANAVAVFKRFFEEEQGRTPDITHFTCVINAYSECGDHEGINTWLEKMVKAGFVPDQYVYNSILRCFAERGQVTSVGAILDQMQASRVAPSDITYGSVIAMLARRKDALAAENIFKRALQEGIVPSRRMVNALINAHVQAGSWEGVVRAFDFLKSVARGRGVGLTISTYNVLLKAYVLAAAPFDTVRGFLAKIREMGVQPDVYTYSLAIQSACDSGLMDAARDLLKEMEERAERWQSPIRINVYVLTIIMAGYLRLGQKARAKAVYDDMVLRGIAPTSYTFSHIINTYSNPQSRQSVAVAEDFVKAIMTAEPDEAQWSTTTRSVRSNVDHLYGPLLHANMLRGNQEKLEKHLQDIFNKGGAPSLFNLTILLDMYRRKHNIDGVKQIWPQIHDLALQESDMDALFVDEQNKTRPRRQANVLTIPLSIYIDALSAAGQHMDVLLAWRQLTVEGFTFDAHNWNHLVVALVRAGEVERAFEVIERVILPYNQMTRKLLNERDPMPHSPLVTDVPRESGTEPAPTLPPLESGRRRADYVKLFTERAKAVPPILNLEEIANPLHVLYQVSPGWNDWRPHGIVLVLLHRVLQHLRTGQEIVPVGGHPEKDAASEHSLTEDEREQRLRDAQPKAILARIKEKYPNTVQAIVIYREFCAKLQQRRHEERMRRRKQKERKAVG